MNLTDGHLLDFFDRHVCAQIQERYGYAELEALRRFTSSQTYRLLAQEDLGLWTFSPLAVLDMWETELATGDPRNSVYLEA